MIRMTFHAHHRVILYSFLVAIVVNQIDRRKSVYRDSFENQVLFQCLKSFPKKSKNKNNLKSSYPDQNLS